MLKISQTGKKGCQQKNSMNTRITLPVVTQGRANCATNQDP